MVFLKVRKNRFLNKFKKVFLRIKVAPRIEDRVRYFIRIFCQDIIHRQYSAVKYQSIDDESVLDNSLYCQGRFLSFNFIFRREQHVYTNT